jgi:protein-S-isoprenylcysteine O-methyltransferase Ste14
MGKAATGPSGTSDLAWLRAIASTCVGAVFLGLWLWLLPGWLGFHRFAERMNGWRWLAAVLSALGFCVSLRCIWDFGWSGRGTPAPIAPPQRLVVVGFYCYVRNPMYVGFFVGWLGLWVIFGQVDRGSLTVAAIFVLAVATFVRAYEEPALRRTFGADYEEYYRNVPRWLPRLSPWRK